jgi:hypothetical protein
MAKRELAVILIAAIGGLFLVGCECNREQFPGLYANFSGTDWHEAMEAYGSSSGYASDPWSARVQRDLSGLNANLSGADWRESVEVCSSHGGYASAPWLSRVRDELSSLNSNPSGADWRENVAGSCGGPAGANPAAPAR